MSFLMVGFYDKDRKELLKGCITQPTTPNEINEYTKWVLDHKEILKTAVAIVTQQIRETGYEEDKGVIMLTSGGEKP